MVLGDLGSNNELLALKSSGIAQIFAAKGLPVEGDAVASVIVREHQSSAAVQSRDIECSGKCALALGECGFGYGTSGVDLR